MFRRGSSRAVSPKKEVRKAPQKVASRDENTAPVEAERPKPESNELGLTWKERKR